MAAFEYKKEAGNSSLKGKCKIEKKLLQNFSSLKAYQSKLLNQLSYFYILFEYYSMFNLIVPLKSD